MRRLAWQGFRHLSAGMTSHAEVEEPDDEEGIAEALRRDAEFEAHPEAGITMEQVDQQIALKRKGWL